MLFGKRVDDAHRVAILLEKLVKEHLYFFERDVFDRFSEFEGVAFVMDHMREFSCELGGVEDLDIGGIGCAFDAVENTAS